MKKQPILKNALLTVLLLLSISNAFAQSQVSKKLENKMYQFFTETLEQNYHMDNEVELYKHFFIEYYNASMNRKKGKPIPFSLKVNKKQLRKINKELFIKDTLHYYYFYPESFYISKNEDPNYYEKKFKEKYPDYPYQILQRLNDNSSTVELLKYLNTESYVIEPKSDQVFLRNIQKKELGVYKGIMWYIDIFQQISFINYATMFIKGDYKNEVEIKEVRKITAVVYWKLLCMQAGINFHQPPKL